MAISQSLNFIYSFGVFFLLCCISNHVFFFYILVHNFFIFLPLIVLQCLCRGLFLCSCCSSIEVHPIYNFLQVICNNTWEFICMYFLMWFFFIDNCYTIFMHPDEAISSQTHWLVKTYISTYRYRLLCNVMIYWILVTLQLYAID